MPEPVSFSVIIPTYNHSHYLKHLAVKIGALGLPLFLIDDGSTSETEKVCQEVAKSLDHVELLRLEQNRGKGAAAYQGFSLAHQTGYSHAILIDADGQHNVEEIPRFIKIAKKNPRALIMGNPVFGSEAPQLRVQGRKITQFWVQLETLRGGLGDALFGFRCYPLKPVMALKANFGQGMDFDPEIAVRLCWAGTPIENLDCQVTYNTTQPSNFDMFYDNLKMIKLHTKLLFEAVLRSPQLLHRKWSGQIS
jgi:glycosyltransferase involved in cell wall biosynthesis